MRAEGTSDARLTCCRARLALIFPTGAQSALAHAWVWRIAARYAWPWLRSATRTEEAWITNMTEILTNVFTLNVGACVAARWQRLAAPSWAGETGPVRAKKTGIEISRMQFSRK